MDPLSDVRSFFDQGDYRRAGDAAEAKLSPGVRPSVRNELLYYLAESSLNLANTNPEAAESRTAAAARHLEEALKTGDDPDVRRLLSRTLDARARQLQNAHRLEKARTTAEQTVALNPGLADAHGTLGGILYDLNEKDAALTRFEAAVRLSPTFTWALYMQGYILYERGGPENYKAAEAAALKAQQTDPGYPWSYRLLRDIYIRQGQDRVAVERFERFRTSYPQVGEIYSQLAYLYHERMAEKDAVAYDKAYNINAALLAMSGSLSESEAADTLNNLVECSVTTGRYAEAEQRARERLASLALPAQRLTMILFLYASQVLRGEWNEAMASLNAAEAEQEKLEAPQSVWVYNGTLNYLATRVPQTQAVQAVRELIQAINFDDRNPDRPHPKAPASIFEVNRQALRAAGAAAAGK
jgi:Tfp pilus assembly protein PilF